MMGWTLPFGTFFGVRVRMHSFFVVLLFAAAAWSASLGRGTGRGLLLWVLVLVAVGVREIARGMATGWFDVEVKSLLLLPTGGIPAYGSSEAMARMGERKVQRTMAVVGPLTSLVFGLALAAVVKVAAPDAALSDRPWVTPEHLLRSFVWVNILLAIVNVLPAWPLDGGRIMHGELLRAKTTGAPPSGGDGLGAARGLLNVGPAIAIALILWGILGTNFWLVMAGMGVLLGAQVERQGLLLEGGGEGDVVKVSDVMLTEYSILSASATLEDAIAQARHTLQDVFPVVRAGNMVGAVGRADIVQALEATGNGYVQGIMLREFKTAAPEDGVIATLNRVAGQAGASSQLVPVVKGERVVGILTPENVRRGMGLLIRKSVSGRVGRPEDGTE